MEKMTDIIDNLKEILGEDGVIDGAHLQRQTSYWNSSPAEALALVRPRSTGQVSEILRLCHEFGQSVVTQGGMTNCVEAADSSKTEIILSTERINQIESIDLTQGTVVAGAGVVLQSLQEACRAQDMLFPLDLGARGSCTIGGNAATNAGGINVLRYGMMRNLVLGMEVVLADGTVLSSMNQMLKNNTAYDLKQLFIGSEGTLGIITRLVLRIFHKPRSVDTALVGMQTFDQVKSFLSQVQQELASDLSAFEVMWGNHYRGVTGEDGHRSPMERGYAYYVIVESEGKDPVGDRKRFNNMMESGFNAGTLSDAVIPQSESERLVLWEIRENFEAVLKKEPYFLYDVSLPITHMEEYVQKVDARLNGLWPGTEVYALGHIADGNVHFFIHPHGEGDSLHQQVDEVIYGELQPYQGSISAEHGIGREKIRWLSQSRTEEEIAVMRLVKQALDPKNVLNPGRVLPPQD